MNLILMNIGLCSGFHSFYLYQVAFIFLGYILGLVQRTFEHVETLPNCIPKVYTNLNFQTAALGRNCLEIIASKSDV